MRWDEPFFRRDETTKSLIALSKAETLVLYCGAGVTRDQTGLGWDGLVSAVFDSARTHRKAEQELNSRTLELIDSSALDPQQKASIVIQRLLPPGLPEHRFLENHLRKILYKDRGWGEGYLLRNIASLAFHFASLEREVIVVTTNYDDYVVRQLKRIIARAESHGSEQRPGLKVFTLDDEKPVVEIAPTAGLGYITLRFVHGIVRKNRRQGGRSGEIVFSERSYNRTKARTTEHLVSLMSPKSSFVVLGASLTDPPLVEALISGADRSADLHVLLTIPSPLIPGAFDETAASQTHNALALRAKHLGVEHVLTPATFSQVAQFVEEVRICTTMTSVTDYSDYARRGAYAKRLRTWWDSWTAASSPSDFQSHHELLVEGLDSIKQKLALWGCAQDEEERLRLEVWLRLDPSISRGHRALTLIANSSGTLSDTTTRRTEEIWRKSNISSVQAFIAGKPTLSSLEQLGYETTASRWKTFLSVPLFHEVSVPYNEASPSMGYFTASVPIGAVTLASSFSAHPSGGSEGNLEGEFACFLDPKMGNHEYRRIIARMVNVGRKIGAPGPVTKETARYVE